MLPILRSRRSRVLVALLCALVLLRMPVPVCAEDAFSSAVKIEESTAKPVVVVAVAAVASVVFCASTTLVQVAAFTCPTKHVVIEQLILRL